MARANTHGRENEERLSPGVGAAAPGLAESWAPRRADDPARGNALARRRRCGRVLCREAVGKCGKTAVSGSGREAAQECNVRGLPRGQRLLSRSRRHRRTCIWRTASQVSRGDTVRHWRRRGHDGRDRSGHLRTQRSRRRARAADGTMTTARSACWMRSRGTLPRSADLASPRPRVPTTTASASTRPATVSTALAMPPSRCSISEWAFTPAARRRRAPSSAVRRARSSSRASRCAASFIRLHRRQTRTPGRALSSRAFRRPAPTREDRRGGIVKEPYRLIRGCLRVLGTVATDDDHRLRRLS